MSLPCCQYEPSSSARLKIITARHPYAKLVSAYNHPAFCVKRSKRYVLCRSPLGEANKHDFKQWVQTMVKRYPTDAMDTTNHFKSQAGHFWDPRNLLPYNAREFFVLHLETLAQDWERMQKKLCEDYLACQKLGSLAHRNALAKDAYGNIMTDIKALTKVEPHDYSVIINDKKLRNLITSRFADDFIWFGYDPMNPAEVSLPTAIRKGRLQLT